MLYSRWVQVIFVRRFISASIHLDIFAIHPRLTAEDRSLPREDRIAAHRMPPTNEGRW